MKESLRVLILELGVRDWHGAAQLKGRAYEDMRELPSVRRLESRISLGVEEISGSRVGLSDGGSWLVYGPSYRGVYARRTSATTKSGIEEGVSGRS